MKIETKKELFTNPLYLESGRILEPYELVYETYGELAAFGYGWSALWVTYPASMAAIATVFASYLARWVPLSPRGQSGTAAPGCRRGPCSSVTSHATREA